MYVDKKLQGAGDCVQTLSRLNRQPSATAKKTFILGLLQTSRRTFSDGFLPYYTKAELTDVTDPQIITTQKKLDAEGDLLLAGGRGVRHGLLLTPRRQRSKAQAYYLHALPRELLP